MAKSQGLGDTIAKITKFFKIDKLVKSINKDCGCDKRQEYLNKLVPYKKDETIFIQIAAYRDPELLKTIKDLLKNSYSPENLKICIAWQHSLKDKWDYIPSEYLNDPKFKILDIPYTKSKGVCWARNQIQQHYGGETYTLQLDSHHRFIKNWDKELIQMYKSLQSKGHKKPLITSYLPSYFPKEDPKNRTQEVWKMDFNRFTPEGYIFTYPSTIDNYKTLKSPIPARFYSAHFAFTTGKFCNEVQHDPNMYFHGEEPSIAARAFTWGYDLFHPHKILAWHEYTREGKVKQWDDDKKWDERDRESHLRYRKMHGMDGEKCSPCVERAMGKYFFGKERTLEEYEKYIGVRFKDRKVQKYTLDFQYPPNPQYNSNEEYEESLLSKFKHCIDIWGETHKEKDYDFWVVSFEMEDGTVIDRQDADKEEVLELLNSAKNGDGWVRIWREFNGPKPDKWVVWPHSKSKGFIDRIEQNI